MSLKTAFQGAGKRFFSSKNLSIHKVILICVNNVKIHGSSIPFFNKKEGVLHG